MSTTSTAETPAVPDSASGTYQGNCHCGAVVYLMKLTPPFPETKVGQCNCSICAKNGYLLVYPRREDVQFVRGFDSMKSYQMGAKVHAHRFCPECSSSVMIDFNPEVSKQWGKDDLVAMNVRLLKDFDQNEDTLAGMKLVYDKPFFDGMHKLKPLYQAPSVESPAE